MERKPLGLISAGSLPYDQAVTANPQTPENLPEGQCPPLPAEIFPFAAGVGGFAVDVC